MKSATVVMLNAVLSLSAVVCAFLAANLLANAIHVDAAVWFASMVLGAYVLVGAVASLWSRTWPLVVVPAEAVYVLLLGTLALFTESSPVAPWVYEQMGTDSRVWNVIEGLLGRALIVAAPGVTVYAGWRAGRRLFGVSRRGRYISGLAAAPHNNEVKLARSDR